MLSKKLKFTDSARVAKFHLELEIKSLLEKPRCSDILNKIGLYSLEIAGDEDDNKLAFENVDNAIECFVSSIRFEGGSKVRSKICGRLRNLEFLEIFRIIFLSGSPFGLVLLGNFENFVFLAENYSEIFKNNQMEVVGYKLLNAL